MTPKSADFGSPTSYLGPGIRFCPISLRPPCMQHLGTSSNLLFYLTPCLWNGDVSDIYRSVAILAQTIGSELRYSLRAAFHSKIPKRSLSSPGWIPSPFRIIIQTGDFYRVGKEFKYPDFGSGATQLRLPTFLVDSTVTWKQPKPWILSGYGYRVVVLLSYTTRRSLASARVTNYASTRARKLRVTPDEDEHTPHTLNSTIHNVAHNHVNSSHAETIQQRPTAWLATSRIPPARI